MNTVADIMIHNPPLCTPLTRIDDIKKLMEEKDAEEILVVDSLLERHLVGFINGQNISQKSVERGVLPSDLNAEECMHEAPATIGEMATREECLRIMDAYQISKITVVGQEGEVRGVVKREALTSN